MSSLDPSPEDFRSWGQKALESMVEYLRSRRDGRLYPQTTSKEIRSHFDADLPRDGAGFDKILETFCETVIPLTRQSGHRRMFGYVQSPSASLGVMADFLASTLNANLTAWQLGAVTGGAGAPDHRMDSPDHRTSRWNGRIVHQRWLDGQPGTRWRSRERRPVLISCPAVSGPLPRALKLYISRETHHSVAKAAALLGLGTEAVRHVPGRPKPEASNRSSPRNDCG